MTDEATPTQAELDAAKATPDKAIVPLSIPVEMKNKLQELADAAHTPVSTYARKLVADAIGFVLPANISTRQRFANADERKAKQKEVNAERNATVKALLAMYRKGEIVLKD